MSGADRERQDIAALEAAWHAITDYAERHELIADAAELGYFGMRSPDTADGLTPRASKAISAMNWIRSEIRRSQARLRKAEREGVRAA